MSQHASDVRTARVLFLAADLSKVGGVDVVPIVRSLMHVLFAVCPTATNKKQRKQRKY